MSEPKADQNALHRARRALAELLQRELQRAFRDEFFNVESFSSLLEVKILGREHREKYNHRRPHSSLGDLTPAEFCGHPPEPPGLFTGSVSLRRVSGPFSAARQTPPIHPKTPKTNIELSGKVAQLQGALQVYFRDVEFLSAD